MHLKVQQDTRNLTEEEFALLRRDGFGASDAPVLLGCMSKFGRTITTLIAEKQQTEITDDEREVGRKVNVRKGKDLEGLVLDKASELLKVDIARPHTQYRIQLDEGSDYLTVNFDGVIDCEIPVEAKWCSPFGMKYYDPSRACMREDTSKMCQEPPPMSPYVGSVATHLSKAQEHYGIPDYYYVQLQQQIFALQSEYGYLASLFDKAWELCLFKIPRDPFIISQIQITAFKVATTLGWV